MDAVPFIRGVTVSGGEPTIHHKKACPIVSKLREEGLTCYLIAVVSLNLTQFVLN